MRKPYLGSSTVFFYKDKIKVNEDIIVKTELQNYLNNMLIINEASFILCFDKNSTYESYIQNKIFIKEIKLNRETLSFDENQEFIY
jgi:hypothetical protein